MTATVAWLPRASSRWIAKANLAATIALGTATIALILWHPF